MNGAEFERAIRTHIGPAMVAQGLELQTRLSGRLYSAEFVSPRVVVSISFEPGDDYLLVLVFTVSNGERSDIDDRSRTPRLPDLNERYLTKADAAALARENGSTGVPAEERRLQRIGLELSLVLPRYLRDLGLSP